ncbi:hypothetical protein [Chryseolinea soli]|uniref:hypothetical protein n=1 Tax=Chryseolinea soli TaxID=2321403 RepID=UPI003AAFDAC1
MSKKQSRLVIEAEITENTVHILFQDNGIGISEDWSNDHNSFNPSSALLAIKHVISLLSLTNAEVSNSRSSGSSSIANTRLPGRIHC